MITRFYKDGRLQCTVDGLYPFEQDGRLVIRTAITDMGRKSRTVQMSSYEDRVEDSGDARSVCDMMVRSITVRDAEPRAVDGGWR